MYINKNILKRNVLKRKTLHIPEWDGEVVIRELTGTEAIALNQSAVEINLDRQAGKFDADKAQRWEARTVVAGWINEDGSHVLEASDIDELLNTQPRSVIERIATEIRILSGMAKAKPDAPSPADEAKKNLSETPSIASGSA